MGIVPHARSLLHFLRYLQAFFCKNAALMAKCKRQRCLPSLYNLCSLCSQTHPSRKVTKAIENQLEEDFIDPLEKIT